MVFSGICNSDKKKDMNNEYKILYIGGVQCSSIQDKFNQYYKEGYEYVDALGKDRTEILFRKIIVNKKNERKE